MLTFMGVNQINLCCTDEELISLILQVASGRLDYDGMLEWLKSHLE